jgi:hypothetical protein
MQKERPKLNKKPIFPLGFWWAVSFSFLPLIVMAVMYVLAIEHRQ